MTSPIPAGSGGPQRRFTIERATGNPLDGVAKVVYLGGPKSGKTYLGVSWNECSTEPGEPGLFGILFDPNTGTISQARPEVPHVVVDSTEQFRREVLPWIFAGGLAAEYPSVRAILTDSLSFYAKMVENESGGDWQLVASRFSQDLGQLTRLANPNAGLAKLYHWVATCHEKDRYTTTKTASGQRERHLVGTEPAIAGQMASLICGYFDVVLYANRTARAVEATVNGAKQYIQQPHFECRAMEPPNHKAPAGGTLWGRSITGASIDGTYRGLRTLCGETTQTAPAANTTEKDK